MVEKKIKLQWAGRFRERVNVLADVLGNLLVDAFHYLALFAIGAATVWSAVVAFLAMAKVAARLSRPWPVPLHSATNGARRPRLQEEGMKAVPRKSILFTVAAAAVGHLFSESHVRHRGEEL